MKLGRHDIVDCLGRYWKFLQSIGLFGQVASGGGGDLIVNSNQPAHARLRGYYTILRDLAKSHDLQPWRRAVAEYCTLQCYNDIVEGVRERCSRERRRGRRGASARNSAHKEYIKQVFPDASCKELEEHAKRLKSDLQTARRWDIFIRGTQKEDGTLVPGVGKGLILAAAAGLVRIM
ncbi:hypothetical protein PG994_009976 [Apiospora phragmitis]|uniref:Uncharacterized protein n=1 Tax=Apiospora phragmitis TaxID=2905665 RepID=A0ABR1TQU7_9PEZI